MLKKKINESERRGEYKIEKVDRRFLMFYHYFGSEYGKTKPGRTNRSDAVLGGSSQSGNGLKTCAHLVYAFS